MPRIPYPETTDITPENAALLADLPDLNVFRALASGWRMCAKLNGALNA